MKCLCCGQIIKDTEQSERGWHKSCIRRFFGTNEMPLIDVSESELEKLVDETVNQGLTVPGVQKKLSLHLSKEECARLTLVDYPTGFILKPQTRDFEHLPEAEDLVMRMATVLGIKTVPHALIEMGDSSGELAYITKRIDRDFGKKTYKMYAMEDFCQLAGRQTEDKYKGSYELCAKIISRYSGRPGLDLSELFIRILFFYISGNSDMHLKNFSLIETAPGLRGYVLSPAYDMLPVNLIMPEDKEMLALTLCGKKKNIRRADFLEFADNIGLGDITATRIIDKLMLKRETLIQQCEESHLTEDMCRGMIELLTERMDKLLE